jgi:hypothetical protein
MYFCGRVNLSKKVLDQGNNSEKCEWHSSFSDPAWLSRSHSFVYVLWPSTCAYLHTYSSCFAYRICCCLFVRISYSLPVAFIAFPRATQLCRHQSMSCVQISTVTVFCAVAQWSELWQKGKWWCLCVSCSPLSPRPDFIGSRQCWWDVRWRDAPAKSVNLLVAPLYAVASVKTK